jgi:hypothetical protein
MLAAVSDVSGRANTHAIHLWPLLEGEPGKPGSHPRLGSPRVLAKALPRFLRALAFSPDGRTVAIPGDGGTVRLLETASGKERGRFAGHGGEVWSLAFSPDGRRLASGSLDTTILVWDLTGRLQGGRLRAAGLSARELEGCWADLAAEDAARAGRALWTLAATPAQAVPYLAERLRSTAVDAKALGRVPQLIRDLDDETFSIREKAHRDLQKLGEAIVPALRRALAKAPSLEMQRRLEELLAEAQRNALSGRALRGLRAVEALEQVGTREARQVLEALTGPVPELSLAQEARAALHRLRRAGR